jgi:CheY-like chemotaxis protein
MLAKHALVVDDSKSARAFLTKLLQEQQMEVAAAETAEQAIDYLTSQRPDVIFMDHLMPGMDGFQAVQAIKANPRTATIPILMYTSQEGELYLGQAQALGAAGVLSKSASPADVRVLLQQLQLAPAPAQAPAAPVRAAALPVTAGSPVDEVVREEVAALRQHLSEALDVQGKQVVREVRGLIREAAAAAAVPAPTPAPAPRHEPPVILPEKPRHSPVPWFLALAAGVAAAVFGTLWWQGQQQVLTLRADLMDSRSTVTLLTARLGPAPQASDAVQPVEELVLNVPIGEAPLSAARVEALREFVGRVAALGQKGTVEVVAEGNAAAAGNNRVEMRWHPAP